LPAAAPNPARLHATITHQPKGLDVSAAAHPLTDEPTQPSRRPQLEVVDRSSPVDLARAERAVADLLAAFGQDRSSAHLADMPRRVAASFAELLTPTPFTLTTFPNDEGYDELVLARAIPFSSLCQHHLLPFRGVAHVGYLPGDRILGLSKLARVVELFARRLQLQERLTTKVADWLQAQLAPKGVGGRAGGRAPLHDASRRASGRRPHRHLDPARPAAQRPTLAAGVPHPHRRRHLNHRFSQGSYPCPPPPPL
jgi:GTP cyclohydrolase IA